MNKHQAQYLLKHASVLQKEAAPNPAKITRGLSKGLQSIKKLFGYGDEAAKVVNPPRPRLTVEKVPDPRAGTPVPRPRGYGPSPLDNLPGSSSLPVPPKAVQPPTPAEFFDGPRMPPLQRAKDSRKLTPAEDKAWRKAMDEAVGASPRPDVPHRPGGFDPKPRKLTPAEDKAWRKAMDEAVGASPRPDVPHRPGGFDPKPRKLTPAEDKAWRKAMDEAVGASPRPDVPHRPGGFDPKPRKLTPAEDKAWRKAMDEAVGASPRPDVPHRPGGFDPKPRTVLGGDGQLPVGPLEGPDSVYKGIYPANRPRPQFGPPEPPGPPVGPIEGPSNVLADLTYSPSETAAWRKAEASRRIVSPAETEAWRKAMDAGKK